MLNLTPSPYHSDGSRSAIHEYLDCSITSLGVDPLHLEVSRGQLTGARTGDRGLGSPA